MRREPARRGRTVAILVVVSQIVEDLESHKCDTRLMPSIMPDADSRIEQRSAVIHGERANGVNHVSTALCIVVPLHDSLEVQCS